TAWDVTTIKDPVYGKDVYSKERADNEYKSDKFSFDNISFAVPFQFAGKQLVAAGSYHKRYDVHDYDWNGTHLNPTWQTSEITEAEIGDTTRTDWSVYTRERTGDVYSMNAALAMKLNNHVQLGFGLSRFSGETDDELMLDRVGYFLTEHGGENWAFSHDSFLSKATGTSKFSSLQFNFGSIIKFDNFNLGFSVKLPYTIEREWEYTTHIKTADGSSSSDSSGVDKVDIPATYNFGLTFKPYSKLTLSFDFEKTNYNKTTYNLAETDQDSLSQYMKWVDQFALGFGVEYNLTKRISLLAGYQSRTTPFIPYGVAIRNRGPSGETYSVGFSVNALMGRFDVSYNYYQLKYYDAFFTNNNYTLQSLKRLSFGYTIFL
ncbi:MAG: outer membrane protein transport protein, partial [bacterium]